MRVHLSDSFHEAADEWAEQRVMTEEAALESKAEQALLEIEHLVTNSTEVAFELDDGDLVYDPSDGLYAFLSEQAEDVGIDPETVLSMYVDLFAGAFLSDDTKTPEDDTGATAEFDPNPNFDA